MFRADRSQADKDKHNKAGGGGVFILVRQDIDLESSLVNIKCEAPVLSASLKFRDKSKICISTCYRYGYSKDDMHTEIDAYFKEVCKIFDKLILIGDFNLNTVKYWNNPMSSNASKNLFIETFHDLGFEQLIHEATHKNGNILDLLLTNQPGLVSNINIQPNGICVSDNISVYFTLNKNVPRKKPTIRKLYNFKKANLANLNHMLRKVKWSRLFYGNDINSAWNLFKSKLDQFIRVNIPTISIKSKYRPPWFDSEMHKLCIHKESGSEDELNKFKDARKEFRKKAKEKMNSFIADDLLIMKMILKRSFGLM